MPVVVVNKLGPLIGRAPGMTALAVESTVANIEAQAKATAPVDTGNLKGSITGQMEGRTQGRVIVGAEYGIYVEYGTHKMSAQPYLMPAAESQRSTFEAMVRQAFS